MKTLGAIPSNQNDILRKQGGRYRVRQRGDGRGNAIIPAGLTYGEMKNFNGTESNLTGTSIFDPVLCELAYRWFCPPGGQILDPFAGGSVRGVVAGLLGYKYHGIDLSKEQIAANELQWPAIYKNLTAEGQPASKINNYTEDVSINISMAMLRQAFQLCMPDYIKAKCRGRCCQGTGRILVTVHPSEIDRIKALGADIVGGFIVADDRGLCPFKSDDGLCRIHGDEKPFGCQASPFTLNSKDTLIVRNRYRLLKCYSGAGAVPAYRAHEWSLGQIFGKKEAQRIIAACESGAEQLTATISGDKYEMLKENDEAKHNQADSSIRINGKGAVKPAWICGDSLNLLQKAPAADFVFSCPPYGNLEVYSDNPADISTMDYPEFMAAYKKIIALACAKLKDNRFACFVVGEFRDKRSGAYQGFVPDTINAFRECGLDLYNEAILVTAVGSLPIRIGKQFEGSRKLGKTHQNVLIFIKGNAKTATMECGQIDIQMPDEATSS